MQDQFILKIFKRAAERIFSILDKLREGRNIYTLPSLGRKVQVILGTTS